MTGAEPVNAPITPGQVIPAEGGIELNAGAQRTTMECSTPEKTTRHPSSARQPARDAAHPQRP